MSDACIGRVYCYLGDGFWLCLCFVLRFGGLTKSYSSGGGRMMAFYSGT